MLGEEALKQGIYEAYELSCQKLKNFDQLNFLRSEGLVFSGYVEDPIRFVPTYKYDPGSNNFDTSSKQRVPSYTDRILYKSQKLSPVTPLHYDSVRDVVTSG